MFKEIHDLIEEDNLISGIAPSALGRPNTPPSNFSDYGRQMPEASPRPLSMPSAADFRARSDFINLDFQSSQADEVGGSYIRSSRPPPPVHPKPNGMHAPRVSHERQNSVSSDSIAERFAKLRPTPANASGLQNSMKDMGIIEINSSEQRSTNGRYIKLHCLTKLT